MKGNLLILLFETIYTESKLPLFTFKNVHSQYLQGAAMICIVVITLLYCAIATSVKLQLTADQFSSCLTGLLRV